MKLLSCWVAQEKRWRNRGHNMECEHFRVGWIGRYEPRNREFDSQRLGEAKQIEEEYHYWP